MKILLIYPHFLVERIHEEEISVPPLGVYYVAALLRENGYDVEVLNWSRIGKELRECRKLLKEKKPAVIGLSLLQANRWGGIEIARTAKELYPETKIVCGGVGAHFLWEHLLTHFQEIDYAVLGEGEFSLLNLIRRLESAPDSLPEEIPGLAFRKDGRPFRTAPATLLGNLDRLPDPAQYFTFQHVVSSRGCAWECAFCGSPQFWGRRVRFHSPAYFVDQLERLFQRGVSFFYVSDDTLTMDKRRLVAICRDIIDRNLPITWNAISRVDGVDEEVLYWMRKAGCIQISYGIESANAGIRKILNKKIRLEDVQRAFPLTQSYGIMARAYFIYGSPGETEETIRETIDLLHEIKPLGAIFYILDLFPGTELYRRLQAHGILTDDIWLNRIEGIMYAELDPGLSDEKILSFGRTLRSAFYENVHAYASQVQLVDRPDLAPFHADFLSRLGLTFSQGDYARNSRVREKEKTAESLFRRALGYAPDHRAYLGLGMLKQREGQLEASNRWLREGLEHYPGSPALNRCLGLNLLQQGDFRRALACFEKFPDDPEAAGQADRCRRALRE
jgi:anaerobic magnesium-protoporphyrin IX monomethyl ester cyclase